MDTTIRITSVSIRDVRLYDKVRYNTNNIWVDGVQPKDYHDCIGKCNTSLWIDKFHNGYKLLTLDTKEVRWLKEAFCIGCQTLRFPHQYDDELEALLGRYNDVTIFNGTPYFVRTEGVSLKRGLHGVGPYFTLQAIIESLVTCILGHCAINSETIEVKLYLLPWVQIPYYKEFRVFVCNKKVTAISQQHLYDVNDVLTRDASHAHRWCKLILEYFRSTIKDKINLDNYVIDMALLEDDTPYFIEINTFGMEYASGASLFGWKEDYEVLYGLTDYIEFRWTTE